MHILHFNEKAQCRSKLCFIAPRTTGKNEKKKHGCCKYMRVKFLLQPSRTRHTWQTKLHPHPFCLQFPLQDMHYWATNIGRWSGVRSLYVPAHLTLWIFFAASQKSLFPISKLDSYCLRGKSNIFMPIPRVFITCYSLKLSLQAVRCWMEPNAI